MAEQDWKRIKQANSKGDLVKHIQLCHLALEWYGRKENWNRVAGTNPTIWVWKGDDLPTYAADVTLNKQKPDPNYKNNWQKQRELTRTTLPDSVFHIIKQEEGKNAGYPSEANPEDRGSDALLEQQHKRDAES